jgi:hemolysin activation/secretion protein
MSFKNSQTVLLLFLLFSAIPLHAQVLPVIPVNTETGALSQPRTLQDTSQLPPKPKEQVVEEAPPEEDPGKKLNGSKIQINQIDVLDNTLIPQYEIDHITNQYIGKQITIEELQAIAGELTRLYQKKGYLTSKFYLPPQQIKDGIVSIQASEGLIKPISLYEGSYFKRRSIFPRLQQDQYDNLNINRIKNDLARINENPDINLQATLRAGKQAGQTELIFHAKDKFPIHVSPSFDNLGRKAIGNNRLGLGITHNNLFGFGDRNITNLSWTSSSFTVANNYEIPIGKYGTKLGFAFHHTDLRVIGALRALDIEGKSTTYTPYISQELYRSPKLIASGDLALDFKNLSTDILDRPFHVDRLRVLRPGLNIDQYDKHGRTFIRNELGIGLGGVLGASSFRSPLASRLGYKTDFFRYTGNLTRITQLPWGIQDVFRLSGQYSPHILNSAEQTQVGGAFSVRGYREGQFIGDSGYVVSNELRIPFYLFPKKWKFPMTVSGVPAFLTSKGKNQPTFDYVFRDNIQLVGFADFGGTFTNSNRLARTRAAADSAIGVGAGLRVRLSRFLVGRVDVGFPLVNDFPNNRQNHMFHFGLQSELF